MLTIERVACPAPLASIALTTACVKNTVHPEIGVEHRVEILRLHLDEVAADNRTDAGIVHQAVDCLECLQDVLDGLAACPSTDLAGVSLPRQEASHPERTQRLDHRIVRPDILYSGDRDVMPRLRQRLGNSQSDTLSSSGDKRDRPPSLCHHASSFCRI